VLHACRAKFLALPSKMAPVLANVNDTAVIKDHLEGAVREALQELANYQPNVDATKAGSAPLPDDPQPEPEKRKVGRPRKTAAIGK
jgi:hypothetical protein